MTPFEKAALKNTDLQIDAVYSGGRSGNAADDPLPHLLGVSNQGGFRYIGTKFSPRIVALTSTLSDPDWPDSLDRESGIFTYYGDNKRPGHELHDTPRFGNLLLRDMFQRVHGSEADRLQVPPVFVFANTGLWRDVEFLGLMVPGAEGLDANSDLVAVWKLKDGKRFQNYQAKFTVLPEATISRKWIEELKQGNPLAQSCPPTWRQWAYNGVYRSLKAPRAIEYRSRDEQLPSDKIGREIINGIRARYESAPHRFEACAAKVAELMLGNVVSIDLTRPVKDGGRDAVGSFRIGDGPSAVLVEFALEAKCYGEGSSVGVHDLSRLISRLRHRQFGILVTTSYVGLQAYQEIKEDQHPIVIISAVDIVRTLRTTGINSLASLTAWLDSL
jgi:hypothetical protein